MYADPLARLLRLKRWWPQPFKLGILERLWGHHLARAGFGWVDAAYGLPRKLNLANTTHRWTVRHLRPDAPLVVSGSNIGQMIASLRPLLNLRSIHAFEPDRQTRAWVNERFLIALPLAWSRRWVVRGIPEKKDWLALIVGLAVHVSIRLQSGATPCRRIPVATCHACGTG